MGLARGNGRTVHLPMAEWPAARKRRREDEGAVGRDGQIIAAVVLQHNASSSQAGHSATNGEGCGGAGYLDAVDVGCSHGAGPLRDTASLAWRRGLRLDGDSVRAPDRNGGWELEAAICRDGEIIACVVLQNETGASDTNHLASHRTPLFTCIDG